MPDLVFTLSKATRRTPSRVLATALALLGLACAGWPTQAVADKSDRDQPLNFAADSARVDENQRVNVLTGNVEITKGSIILRSARVEVRQERDGSQIAIATGGAGGRALFRQRRDSLDEFIEGEAERVEYDGRADVVRFTGRAIMRRLSGAIVSDEVQGQTIVYDNKTEVFQVVGSGGATGPGGAVSPGGRVRGVIAPRKTVGSVSPDAAKDSANLSASGTLSKPALESAR